jgi:phospholipid/cholesterol/gamma-HCH transport system substrate-binding protein
MKINYVAVGTFLVVALLLFSVGLFLIGDRQQAFSRHDDYYTELRNVNGIVPGSKVRVAGFDAGQVTSLQLPDMPSAKFRLKLHLDEKLRKLIRTDSLVTVESDGLVGDKFLLIHSGTDNSQQADNGATLPSKEPIELSAVIEKVSGVVDQANGMIVDVRGKLDVALDTTTETIGNVDGLVTDARHGKGSVGVLLNDPKTAAQLRQTVANAESASDRINQITVQAGQMVTDVQSRNLPGKIDGTLTDAHDAVDQLKQASEKVNITLNDALGPDRSGQTAAENIRQSLSNVNLATANIAEDTEALKHGFLFRGYFKKRGFYSFHDLTPEQYRTSRFFQNPSNRREWLDASTSFTKEDHGAEVLTTTGQQQIDRLVGDLGDGVIDHPIIIEGYSTSGPAAEQINESRTRSILVARYLEKRFHLRPQDIGEIPLGSTPPSALGRPSWNGVCLVILAKTK